MTDGSFWAGQRVLLTGHTGFKGVWLGLWLTELGAQVFGVALPSETSPSLFDLVGATGLADSAIVDIRDRAALGVAVSAADPTVVIHLAAQALVRRGYRLPLETFQTNVMGTLNLLDALQNRPKLRVVLIVTTDKVYRNLENGRAFCEEDPLGAHDPYSASKAAAEIAVGSWGRSFFASSGIPVLTARAGNVIGGGDWSEDRLVPDIWRAVESGTVLRLRHPRATRPWQHVAEPLGGYLRYIEAASGTAEIPRALNFGPDPGDRLTVAEMAQTMLSAMGAQARWQEEAMDGLAEGQNLVLDSRLAARVIGWRPRLSSGEAIRWTAEWYRQLATGGDARELCLRQLRRYQALS